MKVLLVGATGLLGKEIFIEFCEKQADVLSVARKGADVNFDLTNDMHLEECFDAFRPDIVINAAALVNLSACEKHKEISYLVNARAVSKMGDLCDKYRSYFMHISTDHYYVDDGTKQHAENEPVRLVNEYARTKFAGECFAATYQNSLIIRTNIVGIKNKFGAPTFLEWVIDCFQRDKEILLFDDFFTSTIHTRQLAKMIWDLSRIRAVGVMNVASSQVRSKKEFILALAKKLEKRNLRYRIGSVKSLSEITRANSLGLNVEKVEKILGYAMPDFEEVMESIAREYREVCR